MGAYRARNDRRLSKGKMKLWHKTGNNKFGWLIGVLLLVLFRPYLSAGVPFTHDGENHLARFANYKVAVREGQLPPRFAPNLVNHYGYPVFNYNYPLANLLSLPPSILGVSYELTFKILMMGALLMAVVGTAMWLKLLGFSRSARWIAGGALLVAPFTANLIYVRGNVGEVLALGLFPWLLWLTKRLEKKESVNWFTSVSLILAFLLSHNISVLFGMALWLLYCWHSFKRHQVLWLSWLKPTILAGLLSLWFWLPALAEKNLVILAGSQLNNQTTDHLTQLQQLISSPLQFGYSYESAIDTLSFAVGLVPLTSLVIVSLWLIKFGRRQKTTSRQLIFWCLLSWWLLFLQTTQASWFWKNLPLVGFIQFPWRLSLFFLIFATPLVAAVWRLGKSFSWLIFSLLIVQLINVSRLAPADRLHKTNLDYDLFSQSTSTLNENLPTQFTYLDFADWSPKPSIASGEASFTVEHWTGSSRRYQLTVIQDALIVEPTMNFAGWQTRVNNQLVEHVNNDLVQGRLAYQLPSGEYQVESRFTQQTWSRLVGNSISGLGLLVWGILIWQEKRHVFGKSSA